MISRVFICLFIFINAFLGFSQGITGVVLDAKTNEPIESASVYFDNTTIGTTTNQNGEFFIEYNENINSLLIISYIGYQKNYISDYKESIQYKVLLKKAINTLDEVFITDDDGMTRAMKLKQFKAQFLGFSKNAKSCKILNEEDIILRYFEDEKQLTASSRKPILIRNKNLQYLIAFDLNEFKIDYSRVDIENNRLKPKLILYTGTSRYENLEGSDKKQILKNRQRAYKGSSLHFMRALANGRLEDEKYLLFKKGVAVKVDDYIAISKNDHDGSTTVKLKEPVVIFYDGKQSPIECKSDEFVIDLYGNHTPIEKVIFSGHMGSQRLADSVPLDYDFNKSK